MFHWGTHFPYQDIHRVQVLSQKEDPQEAINKLLEEGTIEPVHHNHSVGLLSSLFLEPEKTGDLRPITDLSTLDRHLIVLQFQMEIVRLYTRSPRWAMPIDMREAYLHASMHKQVQKCLRFMVNLQVYQFTCLPFRLATSPQNLWSCYGQSSSCSVTGISRRLADLGRLTIPGEFPYVISDQGVVSSRMADKLQEIRAEPNPGLWINWNALQNSGLYCGPSTEEADKSREHSRPLEIDINSPGSDLHWLIGTLQYMAPLVLITFQLFIVVDPRSMGPSYRTVVHTNHSARLSVMTNRMVAFPSRLQGPAAASLGNRYCTVYRRSSCWVGTYWKWRPWSVLCPVSCHFCVAEWPVWCATMLQWFRSSDRMAGSSPSDSLDTPSDFWSTVTEWTLFSFRFIYQAFALYKLTVCHVWAIHCPWNGRSTDGFSIWCLPDGGVTVSTFLQPMSTKNSTASHHGLQIIE